METKFTKLDKTQHPAWSMFFNAADSWLEVLQILIDQNDDMHWSIFYVKPTVVAFCIELYTKAITSKIDDKFKGKTFSHHTSKILLAYSHKIPLFDKISRNVELINLVKEYEKTVDVRFGEMGVSIDGDDQVKLIHLIYELRKHICSLTGLR